MIDAMETKRTLSLSNGNVNYFSLKALENKGFSNIKNLPITIKILLESLLRKCNNYTIFSKDIENLTNWNPKNNSDNEFAFYPSRVLMQDFTGVPAIVDLAAMRNAMARLNGDPKKINPLIPVELVIDHSIQVDTTGKNALRINTEKEFERNRERYEFLKWGQKSFQNFKVVPPATGIVHQVNLEKLAQVITITEENDEKIAYPDTVVGTDSHTTMINGLGVVGWGVGGIEAEAVMLGQAIYMLPPKVVGVKLEGKLSEGVTATDLVLTITALLRKHGVVDKFVEFYGPGIKTLSLPDRATIANMAPEYGATMGYFPIDEETLNYLNLTNRENLTELIEKYCKEQEIFYTDDYSPEFSESLTLDLNTIVPCLAGPKRPVDRVNMAEIGKNFKQILSLPLAEKGYELKQEELNKEIKVNENILKHGSVVLAAITSCTNTSNPSVLIGAGILAKKAIEKGLKVPNYVKTSLAPGSKVVTAYLRESGLLKYLEELGFNIVGYGCTSCIGNSGPLDENITKAVKENDLIVSSILSGNRNFEGRVNPIPKANYLASPALVIAYALAGTIDINLNSDPLGKDKNNNNVYLKDIWPTTSEINTEIKKHLKSDLFQKEYENVFKGSEQWNAIKIEQSDLYHWDNKSTYIKEPDYFEGMSLNSGSIEDIKEARVLIIADDSTTTDHISPAGSIAPDSPAAKYLLDHGVMSKDFNSYGSRRGNHEVMMRGTFANLRFRNLLTPDKEGSWTLLFPSKQKMSIYEAAIKYKSKNTPVIILAGENYGMGSSRDWAAKGPALLGVKAVIAKSYERIHRSNLIGMGVIPFEFKKDQSPESLNLDGSETYDFANLTNLKPKVEIEVIATKENGTKISFTCLARVDTQVEIDYIKNKGILQTVIRQLI